MSAVIIPKLRPRQEQLANDIRAAFREYKAVLAVAHTAFGKTVLFSYITASASNKGSRVLILAHRQELISQISKALTSFGVQHGIISPQYTPAYARRVQVASIATLNARLKKIPAQFLKFDLTVLDEAHHLIVANIFGRVYEGLGKPRLLGVTATPERGDGTGLGEGEGGVFQEMVLGPSVRESIAEGYLSNFVVYAPSTPIDLAGVKVSRGDYDNKALAERVDKPMITGNAVAEWGRRALGLPTVVFCVSIAHCKHVAETFQAAGHDFRVIDGTMDDALRKSLIEGLGKTHIGLVSCDIISEGTDVPGIACAVFLRPTKSLGLYIQQAGRAIRPVYAEGADLSTKESRLAAMARGPKPRAVLLDHAGLCFGHGLIDEERDWSLEGRKKKGRKKKDDEDPAVALKSCKKCFAVFAPAPVCPHCGHPVETQARKVEHVEGELKEVTAELAAAMRAKRKEEVQGAKSMEDLERIAAVRGYSPAWAKMTYEAKARARLKYQQGRR